MAWSNQPTHETDTGNLVLDHELESGSEFDIIYFDDDGILVKRDLLALNDSKHLHLDLIRWMKNAEQRKIEQQQLQLPPEGESTAAVLQQDFVPKDTAESQQEQGKVIIAGSTFAGAALPSCSSLSPPEGYPKWDFNWDKRAPNSLIKPSKKRSASASPSAKGQADYNNQQEKQKATRHIFLIRHAQYNHNGKHDRDKTLTELGKRQAEETGKRLKSLGLDFDILITSTMKRAIQTAEIIQKMIGQPEISDKDAMLREGSPTQPEPPVPDWNPKPHRIVKDGPRIEAAFHKYFHRAAPTQIEDSYEIIVCHANVIRYFFCRALQFPREAWSRICLNHASITCLNITHSGRVIARALGDSGHLERGMLTTY